LLKDRPGETTGEFIQFLSHAKGSLAELETQLLLSVQLGFCTQAKADIPQGLITELHKMLASLLRKLLSGN
jgi:four helix bundle protein